MRNIQKTVNVFSCCTGKRNQVIIRLLSISIAVLLLDQTVKFLVVKKIIDAGFHANQNALWGTDLDSALTLSVFVTTFFVFYFYLKKKLFEDTVFATVAFGFMLGGGVGNLVDRLMYGYVVDYIDLCNLFSFNVADLSILAGVSMLSWKILKINTGEIHREI